MRARRIKRADLEAAVAAGERVSEAWRQATGHGDWQARLLEILLRLRLWPRMLEGMRRGGHAGLADYYTRGLRRVRAGGLPGYVLDRWNGEPSEGRPRAHAPGTA